jgi:hypothetical protein
MHKKIAKYYEMLEQMDSCGKGNSEVFDDGSEALYCLLFKLMGDKRSINSLATDWIDWPTASALIGAAESGEYSELLNQMMDHDCGITENCDVVDLNDSIMLELERFVPSLTNKISSGHMVKNANFLNDVWLSRS